MKIIFHPSFDSGYYAEETIAREPIGTAIAGLNGLLETLETHCGLKGSYPTDGERTAEYMKSIEACQSGQFYEKAFRTDPFGVARKLLQWRDRLVMAGWNADIHDERETGKLKALRTIEEHWRVRMKGACDRWKALAEEGKKNGLLRGSDVLECRCEAERLPYIVALVLKECNAQYNLPSVDENWRQRVTIETYEKQEEIYQYIASRAEEYADTVIVNSDNVALNHALYTHEQPMVDARLNNSNPQVLQLFKLALSIYSRPLNIDNLVSYMMLPVGPIPAKLRWRLAHVLLDNGGFGEPNEEQKKRADDLWDLAIADYQAAIDEKEVKKLNPFLDPIKDDTLKAGQLPLKAVKDYIKLMVEWLEEQTMNPDERILQQLRENESMFRQLYAVIGDGEEYISYDEIDRYVRSIYSPLTVRQAAAQVGSLKVVDDPSQLVDAPKSLVWADCHTEGVLQDEYEFLSSSERRWLTEKGVRLPDYGTLLELHHKEIVRMLSQAGKITLCTASYHNNQPLREHPLVAELRMTEDGRPESRCGEKAVTTGELREVRTMTNRLEYSLDKIEYKGRKESNTSIDMLINYPFDYTASYVARLREPDDGQMKNLFTIKGLVAHLVIEQMVADSKKEDDRRKAIRSMCEDGPFAERLNRAISLNGLVLLLQENDVERSDFAFQLQRAIRALVDIMEYKNLTPEGCEMKYHDELETIGNFESKIDLVLSTSDNKWVVFDFKWSFSNKYRTKLETNTSLQLELYKQSMQATRLDVVAVGYYLMPLCTLFTTDFEPYEKGGRTLIEKVEKASENALFEQIKKSFAMRMEQLKNGKIEEGECEEVTDLEYTKETGPKGLLPVGETKKKDNKCFKKSKDVFGVSSQNRFARKNLDYNTNAPANEQITTYPILKGRLK